MTLYEGMFLLDNQAVRANWGDAKSAVTGVLEKHGGTVHTSRRWDERKLAYPIKGRKRGTYLLAYYDIGSDGIDGLRRDLELSETVARYLLLRTGEVPDDEIEKGKVELEDGYAPPPPPEDDQSAEEEAPREAAAEQKEPSAKDGETPAAVEPTASEETPAAKEAATDGEAPAAVEEAAADEEHTEEAAVESTEKKEEA